MPADNKTMLTFTNRWPWKIQEKLTLVLLPLLGAIPMLRTLAEGRSPTTIQLGLLGVCVLGAAFLWWTGHSRKVKSQIVATLDGSVLTVSSLRHGETSGDLSQAGEMRTYQHTVTLENVLRVRTATGDLRIPVRLLAGNPDLAATISCLTQRGDAVDDAINSVTAPAL